MTASLFSIAPDELKRRFLALKTPSDVADLLGIAYPKLTFLIYGNKTAAYTTFQIPKRRSGHRNISAPTTALKTVQRRLNHVLQAVYAPKANVHGFTPGRGILSNAQAHEGRLWILNVDLEDFFPAINFGRVRGMFAAWPYELPMNVATVLAQICCHEQHLPQGAPTSPVVSNMLCAKMDAQLIALAKAHRCTISRYADDITISTSLSSFSRQIGFLDKSGVAKVGYSLNRIIRDNGFRAHPHKIRLRTRTHRQEVTGLVTNEVVNVPREFVRQIRSMMHAWKKFGLSNAEAAHFAQFDLKHRAPHRSNPPFESIVMGKLAHLAHIRGQSNPTYVRLVERGRRFDDAFFRLPIPADAIWVLFDGSTYRQGTAFNLRGVGTVTCWHTLNNGSRLQRSDKRPGAHGVQLVRGHKYLDIAIIKSDAPCAFALEIGDDSKVDPGARVTAVGFPSWSPGQTVQFVNGTVTGRLTRFGTNRIVIAETLIAGISGGPVLDHEGKVIGIAAAGTGGNGGDNMVPNQVLPISVVRDLLQKPKSECSWTFDGDQSPAARAVE